jgi:outer membrane protein assembly factor BamB
MGPGGAVAVDPRTERVLHEIRVSGGYVVRDALIQRGRLWVTDSSGATIRYDGRTGRRLGRVRWATGSRLIPAGDRLVQVDRAAVALVDPRTGRHVWRVRVGQQLGEAAVHGGRVYVTGVDGVSPRDMLWELDVRTGRLARPLVLPEFGPAAIVGLGREVWVLTNGGRAVVVRP